VGVTDPIDLNIESPEAVRDRVLEAAEFGQWGKTRSSKVWPSRHSELRNLPESVPAVLLVFVIEWV
jgi:hypothetical protein